MKKKTLRKNYFLIIISLIMALCAAITAVQSPALLSFASPASSFEKSNVLDDLTSSTVNGKKFDVDDYPFDGEKSLSIISFIEYCYTFRANARDNYGLYVYVYNPGGLKLGEDQRNKLQLSVEQDASGKGVNYQKYLLTLCNRSEGDYYNLFLKYKVLNAENLLPKLQNAERVYNVSGIELVSSGDTSATEYGIGGTYKFTGYSKGCGPDVAAESTLDCTVEQLETVRLNVNHTFYRSQTSELGAGHQNQLNTVYFTVPQRLLDEYGRLQRIKAEWYEYKTKEIVVTSNEAFYAAAAPWIGKPVSEKFGTSNDGRIIYNPKVKYGVGVFLSPNDIYNHTIMDFARWGWNFYNCGGEYLKMTNYLYYLLRVTEENPDPYANKVDYGTITSNELYDYILNYDASFNNGTLNVKNGTISADLFENDIDESRKVNNENGIIQNGYSFYDFDADVDTLTLTSWKDGNPSFWEKWANWGLWGIFSGGPDEESRTAAPIKILTDSDLDGLDSKIAERLMIQEREVDNVRLLHDNGKNAAEKEVVVLFRFATSDYYAENATINDHTRTVLGEPTTIDGQAYVAQQSVFLDFDIIQLTFKKAGNYTVIPVVSSPIDIISDITPPTQGIEGLAWWIKALIIIGIVVLALIALYPWLGTYYPIVGKIIGKMLWFIIKWTCIIAFYIIASPYYLIKWIATGRLKG